MTKDKMLRLKDVRAYTAMKQNMCLGNLKPYRVLRIGIRTTSNLKADSIDLYHEGGNLSEHALDQYLKRRHKKYWWVGINSNTPPDFKLWCSDKILTIDVHSANHQKLMDFVNSSNGNPIIPYPAGRLPNRLDDYIIGASVLSIPDGSLGVAIWGLIERDRLIALHLPVIRGRTGNYVAVPLAKFSPRRLARLINSADKLTSL